MQLAPFEIDTPPVDKIPVEKIADLQPEVGLCISHGQYAAAKV